MDRNPANSSAANPTHHNKSLSELTPEERLESLKAYVEEQKYIQPGGGEIIPWNSGMGPGGGYNSVVFSQPNQGGAFSLRLAPGYQGNLAPPSYDKTVGAQHQQQQHAGAADKPRKESLVKRLLGKHHRHHDEQKDDETNRDESAGSES